MKLIQLTALLGLIGRGEAIVCLTTNKAGLVTNSKCPAYITSPHCVTKEYLWNGNREMEFECASNCLYPNTCWNDKITLFGGANAGKEVQHGIWCCCDGYDNCNGRAASAAGEPYPDPLKEEWSPAKLWAKKKFEEMEKKMKEENNKIDANNNKIEKLAKETERETSENKKNIEANKKNVDKHSDEMESIKKSKNSESGQTPGKFFDGLLVIGILLSATVSFL